jgi:FtsH-binding integral membrane protein
MAIVPDYRTYSGVGSAAQNAAVLDVGLRAYMLRVYNWMASGLLLTASSLTASPTRACSTCSTRCR